MTTVLVVPIGAREVFREDWELSGRDEPYVDHVTDDLTGFLHAITGARDSNGLNKPCAPVHQDARPGRRYAR